LAAVAEAQGRLQWSVQLLAVADALLIRVLLAPSDQLEYDRVVAALRSQLDEREWAAAREAGQALSSEQAIDYELRAGAQGAPGSIPAGVGQ
jgi:hypothetical protein